MLRKIDENDDLWVERWLHPLLGAMERYPTGQSFESCLIELLKRRPDFIRKVEFWFEREPPTRLSVYFVALLACKRLGVISAAIDCQDLWNNVLRIEILEQALEHCDAKVKTKSEYLFTFL